MQCMYKSKCAPRQTMKREGGRRFPPEKIAMCRMRRAENDALLGRALAVLPPHPSSLSLHPPLPPPSAPHPFPPGSACCPRTLVHTITKTMLTPLCSTASPVCPHAGPFYFTLLPSNLGTGCGEMSWEDAGGAKEKEGLTVQNASV